MTPSRSVLAAGVLSVALVGANVLVKPRLQARQTVRAADSVVHGREWRGRVAPALSIASLGGETMATAGPQARLRVLVFFGTWNGDATETLLSLQGFATRAAARRRPLDVLLVNAQESEQVAVDFAHESAPDLPLALDPQGAAMQAFEVRTLPTVIAIDRDGRVALYHEGPLFNVDVALEPLLPRAAASEEPR